MADGQEGGIGKLTFSITTGGNRYDMRMGDFSAADEMAFQNVTGKTLTAAFMGDSEPDSIMVAGLVWLFRRRHGEKKLDLRKVAEELKWADLDSIEVRSDDEEEPAGASAAGLSVELPGAVPSPES